MTPAPNWRNMSDAQRADAYSPSKALPDGDLTPYLRAYADESAAVYAANPSMQTLHYGARASQSLDLFVPQTDRPAPLVIFIHGGYWQALSKCDSVFPASGFLQNGIAFAAIDYTLAPEASLPEIQSECVSAVSLLIERAKTLGIDPSRIALAGSSAGAHLVAMTCANMPASHRPKAAILLSGVFELEPLIGTYINEPLQLDIQSAQACSPIQQDLSRFPPTLLAWGQIETEEFKRQSRAFAQVLPKAASMEIAQRNHFDIVFDLSNDSPLAARLREMVLAP